MGKLIRPDYWEKVVEIDKAFFARLPQKNNSLISGSYFLAISFPSLPEEKFEISITNNGGKISITDFTTIPLSARLKDYVDEAEIFDIHQKDNIVSWKYKYSDEGHWSYYVGIIHDNIIWGKVYVMGAAEWYDYPPEIGTWIISK